MYLIFDTETTGIPHNKTAPLSDLENWPRLVQLAWQLHDKNGKLLSIQNFIVKPEGFDVPFIAERIHGISTARALAEGHDLLEVLKLFIKDLKGAQLLVGHNIEFDINIIGAEFLRKTLDPKTFLEAAKIDTGIVSKEYCQLPGGPGGSIKFPKLIELHQKLFGRDFGDAHDASYDVAATARCFFGLIKVKVVKPLEGVPLELVVYEEPELETGSRRRRSLPAEGNRMPDSLVAEIVHLGSGGDGRKGTQQQVEMVGMCPVRHFQYPLTALMPVRCAATRF